MSDSERLAGAMERSLGVYASQSSQDRAILAGEVTRLREMIEQTADGALVPDCDHLFCPHCGNEVRREPFLNYCDNCLNHDTGEAYPGPPLPLVSSCCYATQEAAIKAREEETANA